MDKFTPHNYGQASNGTSIPVPQVSRVGADIPTSDPRHPVHNPNLVRRWFALHKPSGWGVDESSGENFPLEKVYDASAVASADFRGERITHGEREENTGYEWSMAECKCPLFTPHGDCTCPKSVPHRIREDREGTVEPEDQGEQNVRAQARIDRESEEERTRNRRSKIDPSRNGIYDEVQMDNTLTPFCALYSKRKGKAQLFQLHNPTRAVEAQHARCHALGKIKHESPPGPRIKRPRGRPRKNPSPPAFSVSRPWYMESATDATLPSLPTPPFSPAGRPQQSTTEAGPSRPCRALKRPTVKPIVEGSRRSPRTLGA
jgi:uncharacterized Zn finger protein (UPF0148 family)